MKNPVRKISRRIAKMLRPWIDRKETVEDETSRLLAGSDRTVEGNVDIVVREHFFAKPNYRGTFVEVGAARPDYLSISQSFRSLGWRILSVEPNPEFAALHRNLGYDVIECACGEADLNDQTFFVVKTGGEYHGGQVTHESYSSLGIRDKYANMMDKNSASVHEIKVDVRKLDTILKEHAPDIHSIDILAVDVEGWELEVLRGLSFEIWQPSVLIVENLFQEPSYIEFLNERGYSLWRRLHPNDIYFRQ